MLGVELKLTETPLLDKLQRKENNGYITLKSGHATNICMRK
jgi:hypothetical protein